jgi:hypothetical protein
LVVVAVVHVVPKLHVAVILFAVSLNHQLIHQAQLFQTQTLSVLSVEMVPYLQMEISLNFGSLPKLDLVLENTSLDRLQSTGWDKTNVA